MSISARGLTGPQVHALLHELDAMYDEIMARAEKSQENGGYYVAASQASKAHGVLKAFRAVQYAAGIEPTVWEQIHRREVQR